MRTLRPRAIAAGLSIAALITCAGSVAHAVDDPLDALYARIANDTRAGSAMRVRIYVALCDNDSQGIAPVKNRSICDGERPELNLYWATSGGLRKYLDSHGWKRLQYERLDRGPVVIRARWVKRFWSGGRLRERGAARVFDVEIEALAYRGRHIRQAMKDYLADIHGARHAPVAGHLVGYIGHNYFLDTDDSLLPVGRKRDDHAAARGVFALSCFGQQVILPTIERGDAPILVLNRSLTYPGAWTIGGLLEGIARGGNARQIHRRASQHFAEGKKRPKNSMMRVFSYGGRR